MTLKPNKEKIAGKIANVILWVQTQTAIRMNRLKNLKFILVTFCFISGSLSIYFIVDAFVSRPKQNLKIDHIRTVRSIEESSEEIYSNKIPDEIYQQIQDYKRYADSIGEPIRPGLADSMRILEDMYLQQQK